MTENEMTEDEIAAKYMVAPVAFPFAFCNPVQADMKKLGEKIVEFAEQINPGSGANYEVTWNGVTINLGDCGYRHPLWKHRVFESIDAIQSEIRDAKGRLEWKHLDQEEKARELERSRAFAYDAKYFDTRPALFDVVILLSTAERAYRLIEQGITPDHEDAKYASIGPWDEGLGLWSGMDRQMRDGKWSHKYHWLQVYVVHGGSEGYWLHVDRIKTVARDNKYVTEHTHLMSGKSLGATWHACYASAGRIAYMLGA